MIPSLNLIHVFKNSCRKKVLKNNLSQAYLQMQLEEQSQKYLTISTSKGLKQDTRMPYGVTPASGIFQRFIENK